MLFLAGHTSAAGELFDEATVEFASKVDGKALGLTAVQSSGRLTILDTVARERLADMYGSERIDGLPPAVAYMELYLNAGKYLDKPVIDVPEKSFRQAAENLAGEPLAGELRRTHRLPPAALLDHQGAILLKTTGRATTAELDRATAVTSLRMVLGQLSSRSEHRLALERLDGRLSEFLAEEDLDVIYIGGGSWLAMDFWSRPGMNTVFDEYKVELAAFEQAWRARDASGVNRWLGALEARQSQMPGYPNLTRRELEWWYNRTYKSTIAWGGFAVAMALLIVAAASGSRRFRRLGMIVLALATTALLLGFITRWILSGREWYLPPIMNEFEALVGSALIAAVIGVGIELFRRLNYIGLAAAVYATIALLACFFLPGATGAGIAAMPGILNSPVMAVHVAFIILGHAMVGMTLIISLIYLVVLAAGGARGGATRSAGTDLSGNSPVQGAIDQVAAPPTADVPAGALATIDRCNLIVAQLAAWMVIVGTALGAYWADFAWGHWWDWDIKETWALITCLVYVAILHARFITSIRWRGLVTAVLCIIGCAVMLFNWLVVNYLFAGKHSYA